MIGKEVLSACGGSPEPLATYLSIVKSDGVPLRITERDPWMHQEWDLLWLGNCKDAPVYYDPTMKVETPVPYLTYQDYTVTGPKGDRDYVKWTYDAFGIKRNDDKSQHVRMIKKPYEVYCFQAYTISARGAKKLLYNYAHSRNTV